MVLSFSCRSLSPFAAIHTAMCYCQLTLPSAPPANAISPFVFHPYFIALFFRRPLAILNIYWCCTRKLQTRSLFLAPEQFVAVVQKHRKGGNSRTRLSGAGRLISSVSAGFPSMHQVSPITWSQAFLMRICRQSQTRHVNLSSVNPLSRLLNL